MPLHRRATTIAAGFNLEMAETGDDVATDLRPDGQHGAVDRVLFHSIALACLVGLFVALRAHVWPFTLMVVH